MEVEGVTVSAGVPTIWFSLIRTPGGKRLALLDHAANRRRRRGHAGGSDRQVCREYGVEVRHGWGMTETAAVATMGCLGAEQANVPAAARHALIARQGKSVFGIEIKVVDEFGATLPRDGTSQGELMVRGQWIIDRYYKADASALVDGWFPTGDIATIDAEGTMQIRDRAKDLIKTGGEWISSIDLENHAIGHPAVAMAAVIGVKHPKWDERPLLFVVRKPGHSLERDEILAFLAASSRQDGGCRRRLFSWIRCPWEAPARYKRSCCGSVRRVVQLARRARNHRACDQRHALWGSEQAMRRIIQSVGIPALMFCLCAPVPGRCGGYRLPGQGRAGAQTDPADRRAQRSAVGDSRTVQRSARGHRSDSDTSKLPLPKEPPDAAPLMTDIPRLRAGMVGGQFWSVWVPVGHQGARSRPGDRRANRSGEAHGRANTLRFSRSPIPPPMFAESTRRARIASLIGIEGGHQINDSLAVCARCTISGRAT